MRDSFIFTSGFTSMLAEISWVCPVCNGRNIIQDLETGEIVCHDCGYVQSTGSLNRGQDWRAYTLDDMRTMPRTGPPYKPTIPDGGLSSSLFLSRDHYGRNLKPDVKEQFNRLRKWNRRSKITSSNQLNLAKAFGFLDQLSEELSVPRIVTETSAMVYRQVVRKGCVRGRTINSLVAASLYIGCRICEVSRSIAVIADASNIPKKEVARNYRYLHDLLDQDIPGVNMAKVISMLISQSGCSGDVERVALEVLRAASGLKITGGKCPRGLAAASVYIACRLLGEKKTQDSMASKAGVTAVTIRNRYKEIVNRLNLDILL
jgi:transcription initiation factor TFIIB